MAVRIDAASKLIGTSLQAALQVRLVESAERIAQLGSGIALRRTESALGVLHSLFELSQIARHPLAIVGQLALLLALGRSGSLTSLAALALRRPAPFCADWPFCARLSVLAEGAAHALGLGALLLRQSLRFARQLIDLPGSLLLLHAAEQIGGFAEPVGGAAGIGVVLPCWPCEAARRMSSLASRRRSKACCAR